MRVGDKVRVLRHRNFHGDDVGSLEKGRVVTLKKITDQVHQVPEFIIYETECGWLVRSDDVDPVTEGPVRTVTRREIVPGVYGIVLAGTEKCRREGAVSIVINADANAEELREAAHLFNQLAEALSDAS